MSMNNPMQQGGGPLSAAVQAAINKRRSRTIGSSSNGPGWEQNQTNRTKMNNGPRAVRVQGGGTTMNGVRPGSLPVGLPKRTLDASGMSDMGYTSTVQPGTYPGPKLPVPPASTAPGETAPPIDYTDGYDVHSAINATFPNDTPIKAAQKLMNMGMSFPGQGPLFNQAAHNLMLMDVGQKFDSKAIMDALTAVHGQFPPQMYDGGVVYPDSRNMWKNALNSTRPVASARGRIINSAGSDGEEPPAQEAKRKKGNPSKSQKKAYKGPRFK